MKHYQPDWSEQPEEWHEPKLDRSLPAVSGRWIAVLIAVAIWAGVFAIIGQAWGHEAIPTAAQPDGWKYPLSCCSGYDCREVDDTAIDESGPGYTIVATGEFLPMTDAKIKSSPDGEFHWCSRGGLPDSDTICLFVPPRGF